MHGPWPEVIESVKWRCFDYGRRMSDQGQRLPVAIADKAAAQPRSFCAHVAFGWRIAEISKAMRGAS